MPLFGRKKLDGVVVAVRYDGHGQVDWVRAYERSGPAWSDWRLIKRQALVEKLKAGKRYFSGERIKFQAGTFEAREQIQLITKNGGEQLVIGEPNGDQDQLAGVPLV